MVFVSEFRFYHSIEVRYGDLDPQGHVNNANYLTYMEQARVAYLLEAGLWDGKSFDDIGVILANAQVDFLASIQLQERVRVGVRVTHLGEKSLQMEYLIEDAQTQKELARGSTVLVTYDYRERESIPIPEVWRHGIASFEGLPTNGR
jgi:acyl-CoA thioester hydrolase